MMMRPLTLARSHQFLRARRLQTDGRAVPRALALEALDGRRCCQQPLPQLVGTAGSRTRQVAAQPVPEPGMMASNTPLGSH